MLDDEGLIAGKGLGGAGGSSRVRYERLKLSVEGSNSGGGTAGRSVLLKCGDCERVRAIAASIGGLRGRDEPGILHDRRVDGDVGSASTGEVLSLNRSSRSDLVVDIRYRRTCRRIGAGVRGVHRRDQSLGPTVQGRQP